MLRVLLFNKKEKNFATLFVAKQVRNFLVERATSLFNSFCSKVLKQVARFLLLAFAVAY